MFIINNNSNNNNNINNINNNNTIFQIVNRVFYRSLSTHSLLKLGLVTISEYSLCVLERMYIVGKIDLKCTRKEKPIRSAGHPIKCLCAVSKVGFIVSVRNPNNSFVV